MAAKRNPKREKQIQLARAAWAESGGVRLDPDILFGRASNDDVAAYTPEMLTPIALFSADPTVFQLRAQMHF